jgi:hypothetical protein
MPAVRFPAACAHPRVDAGPDEAAAARAAWMIAVAPDGSPARRVPVARRISATKSFFMMFPLLPPWRPASWVPPAAAYLILDASAAFTSRLAWRAPSTVREPMVSSASSGVTSGAIRTRPTTLTWSRSPAALTASRSATPDLAQTELERVPVHRARHFGGMAAELVADRRPDEIRPVRVETLLHEEVDPPEIDIAEVDRDLLALGHPLPQLTHIVCHEGRPNHPCGWYMDVPTLMVKRRRPSGAEAGAPERHGLNATAGSA